MKEEDERDDRIEVMTIEEIMTGVKTKEKTGGMKERMLTWR